MSHKQKLRKVKDFPYSSDMVDLAMVWEKTDELRPRYNIDMNSVISGINREIDVAGFKWRNAADDTSKTYWALVINTWTEIYHSLVS